MRFVRVPESEAASAVGDHHEASFLFVLDLFDSDRFNRLLVVVEVARCEFVQREVVQTNHLHHTFVVSRQHSEHVDHEHRGDVVQHEVDVRLDQVVSGADDLHVAVPRGDEQVFLGELRLLGIGRRGQSDGRHQQNSMQRSSSSI